MGHRCCNKQKVKRGLWSPEEDEKLIRQITIHGHASWSSVPKLAGLQRCGKSCRLRWINYLRPDLKRGSFTADEEQIIIDVHRILGNRWAQIAKHLPGRTDNEVKNFWNSCIKKKLMAHGLDPKTHNLMRSAKSNMISKTHQKQEEEQKDATSVFSIIEPQVENSSADHQLIVTPPFNNVSQPELFQNVEKFTINEYQNTGINYNIAQTFNDVSTSTLPNYGPTLLEDQNITPSKLSHHYLDDVFPWDANFETIEAPRVELGEQSCVQEQQETEKGREGSYNCNQNNKGASFEGSSNCCFEFGFMESIMSEVMSQDLIMNSVDDLVWKC